MYSFEKFLYLFVHIADLSKAHKKKPEVNLESMEPLDRAALAKMFFKQAPYSDVIFEVEKQLIPAHRWWLIKRSKYFANMFSSRFLLCFSALLSFERWNDGSKIRKNRDF